MRKFAFRTAYSSGAVNTFTKLPYQSSRTKNDVKTVVIGAGIAGLSAANHLVKNGFRQTIVLEATDRYGGRVKSKQFGDAFCELGAKWVTINSSKDTVYHILRQATGLQKKLLERNSKYYLNPKGERVDKKMPELIDMLYKRLCTHIELGEKVKGGEENDLNNVQTYFQAETRKIVKSVFKGKEQKIAYNIFNSLFKEFGSLLGCCLEYVNIEHITRLQPTTSLNTNVMYIPTGLDNIFHHIATNIKKDQMRIGKPVAEINWHGTYEIGDKSVACLDGSIYEADHIICTLPLGVLKSFADYMFKPELPKEKQNAIKNLGFGNPVKIYFEYNDNIHSWFTRSIRPLWEDSLTSGEQDLVWTKQVVEIIKVPRSNKVIEILIGGAFYEKIEKLPDTELLQEVTNILRTLLKNKDIPYPVSVLRSDWSSQACYLGGRPFFSVHSTVGDVNTLAAPLGEMPSLLFAGDATTVVGFGTVDGARASGIREAERIIEYYKKPSNA